MPTPFLGGADGTEKKAQAQATESVKFNLLITSIEEENECIVCANSMHFVEGYRLQ